MKKIKIITWIICCSMSVLAIYVGYAQAKKPPWAGGPKNTTTVPTTTTTTTTTTPTTTTTTTITTTTPTPTLLFSDEFNGTGAIDSTKWWATPWCSTSSDDAYGCYNVANAFQSNGNLVLRVSNGTMGRVYDFARIQTFQEGGWPPPKVLWSNSPNIRMEARIKYSPGKGMWGGFWTMGTNTSVPLEIDISEWRGLYPNETTCHVHNATEGNASLNLGVDLSNSFHIYRADYYTDHVSIYADNQLCGTFTTPSQPAGIRFDNVVGVPGTWGGEGGPPDASFIPGDMLVDYVRVWSLN